MRHLVLSVLITTVVGMENWPRNSSKNSFRPSSIFDDKPSHSLYENNQDDYTIKRMHQMKLQAEKAQTNLALAAEKKMARPEKSETRECQEERDIFEEVTANHLNCVKHLIYYSGVNADDRVPEGKYRGFHNPVTREESGLSPGCSPLIFAAWCNYLPMVKYLVDDVGVDVNLKDPCTGKNAAFYAAEFNNLEVLQFLLEKGTYLDSRNHDNADLLESTKFMKEQLGSFSLPYTPNKTYQWLAKNWPELKQKNKEYTEIDIKKKSNRVLFGYTKPIGLPDEVRKLVKLLDNGTDELHKLETKFINNDITQNIFYGELKRRVRKELLRLHPDKNPGQTEEQNNKNILRLEEITNLMRQDAFVQNMDNSNDWMSGFQAFQPSFDENPQKAISYQNVISKREDKPIPRNSNKPSPYSTKCDTEFRTEKSTIIDTNQEDHDRINQKFMLMHNQAAFALGWKSQPSSQQGQNEDDISEEIDYSRSKRKNQMFACNVGLPEAAKKLAHYLGLKWRVEAFESGEITKINLCKELKNASRKAYLQLHPDKLKNPTPEQEMDFTKIVDWMKELGNEIDNDWNMMIDSFSFKTSLPSIEEEKNNEDSDMISN